MSAEGWIPVYWNSYSETSNSSVISIPQTVEDNADFLRKSYIAWIYDLGETCIKGKRLLEHLELHPGFSFWWMTLLAEKSTFKSPRIYDCLRVFALEKILIEQEPSELLLVTSDYALVQTIEKLCSNLDINFNWQKIKQSKNHYSLQKLYTALPYSVQGLLSIRHIATKWTLRKLKKPQWFSGGNAIFLCSYFFNLDPTCCQKGRFFSRQWEELPEFLRKIGKQTNWIHHFLSKPGLPDVETGLKWFESFNSNENEQGYHAFLDTYLSWSVIKNALYNWLLLNITALRLRKISDLFIHKETTIWFWPLLRNDWYASLTGPIAIKNCLWLELFDNAFKEIPRQRMGLYLWENQGWESAMLYAWRQHGHGEIIGVPHSTIRFWDIHNYDDPRSVQQSQNSSKPLPNYLAVNGPMAWKAFVDAGYPVERLLKVEAMRYLYLNKLSQDKAKSHNIGAATPSKQDPTITKKVLILGDFTYKQTFKMLRCMELASSLIEIEISLTLKPHPACPFSEKDYSTLSFEKTDNELAEIIQEFDLAFASNTTSAGLDALLAGIPVAVFLDGEDFNHSPLRGVENIRFVASAKELANTLTSHAIKKNSSKASDYFWLDETFPKWHKVINLNEKKASINHRR